MNEKYCGRCGTPLVSGASFCKRCGTKVEDLESLKPDMKTQFCSRCGSNVPPNASFCKNCGLELARPESVPPLPTTFRYELLQPPVSDRSLSLIEGVLIAICSFPFYAIPGIVAWLVWRGKFPRRARQALLVGIVAFTINVVLVWFILEYRPDLIPEEFRRMLEQPS